MFAHLSIHYPKPEYAEQLLASMHRIDQAAHGTPGLIQMGAWREAKSDRLIGLALGVAGGVRGRGGAHLRGGRRRPDPGVGDPPAGQSPPEPGLTGRGALSAASGHCADYRSDRRRSPWSTFQRPRRP